MLTNVVKKKVILLFSHLIQYFCKYYRQTLPCIYVTIRDWMYLWKVCDNVLPAYLVAVKFAVHCWDLSFPQPQHELEGTNDNKTDYYCVVGTHLCLWWEKAVWRRSPRHTHSLFCRVSVHLKGHTCTWTEYRENSVVETYWSRGIINTCAGAYCQLLW